ncbi:MAG: pilus assembly protein PilZ [Roseovarius sp.]
MANSTDTPPETLAAATQTNALPHRRLTLLGTFDKSDGPTALIRSPTGDIQMVRPGDAVGNATVTAIEMGVLHLTSGQHTTRLHLLDTDPSSPAPKG